MIAAAACGLPNHLFGCRARQSHACTCGRERISPTAQTLTCRTDSFGTTRCDNGQTFRTDSFGTTRDNYGTRGELTASGPPVEAMAPHIGPVSYTHLTLPTSD